MDAPLLSDASQTIPTKQQMSDNEDEKKDASPIRTSGKSNSLLSPKQHKIQNDSDFDDEEEEEEEEKNQFDHDQSDDESDDAYYNQNSLPAKSLKVIKEIISRHYVLLFVSTVFGASIGFIIYLIWSYDVWIFVLGFAGFIAGIILDAKVFDPEKRTKLMVNYEPTKEEKEILEITWEESEDDEFYIQSDFYTPLKGIYRGSSRVYRKKGSGALVFEKKALKRVEEYYGFEIGGGISSFIGFWASLIPTIFSDLGFIIGTLAILFFTIIIGLLGCIIERELRKWNYLPPINVCIIKRDSIAIHDITHIQSTTFGYHFRPLDVSDISIIEKLAIWWFKLIAGIFYIIYCLIKFICYVFWVNSAFTLWLFVTISVGILFHIQISKRDDELDSAMWMLIVTTILSIFCFIYVSPWYRKQVKIGALTFEQLRVERLDQRKQRTLFFIFAFSIILLLICSVFVGYVAGNIHNLATKYFHTDKYTYSVWDKMVCKDIKGNSYPFGSYPFNAAYVDNIDDTLNALNESQLCDDLNYNFLAISIFLLCILWYLLLFTGFWWNHHDEYQAQFSMEGKKMIRKWTQFSYVYIYRKSHTYGSGIFSKSYYIELADGEARKLQHYLNQTCPWYQNPKFVGIHPYSLNFVQQFTE